MRSVCSNPLGTGFTPHGLATERRRVRLRIEKVLHGGAKKTASNSFAAIRAMRAGPTTPSVTSWSAPPSLVSYATTWAPASDSRRGRAWKAAQAPEKQTRMHIWRGPCSLVAGAGGALGSTELLQEPTLILRSPRRAWNGGERSPVRWKEEEEWMRRWGTSLTVVCVVEV